MGAENQSSQCRRHHLVCTGAVFSYRDDHQCMCNGGIPWVWRGRIGEYRLSPERLGAIPSQSPEAVGRRRRVVLPPISKDEDGIPQYVRARLTVLTLLLKKLEPSSHSDGNQFLFVTPHEWNKAGRKEYIVTVKAIFRFKLEWESTYHKSQKKFYKNLQIVNL